MNSTLLAVMKRTVIKLPIIKCLGCGSETNTTTCDSSRQPDWNPRKCYVRWINEKPEKGCCFDELPEGWYKKWCLGIIKRG